MFKGHPRKSSPLSYLLTWAGPKQLVQFKLFFLKQPWTFSTMIR